MVLVWEIFKEPYILFMFIGFFDLIILFTIILVMEIDKFKTGGLKDLFQSRPVKNYGLNNPYNNIDPTESMSNWNWFTDWLGFTNHQNSLWQAQDLAAANFQSNSPSSQAALQRAAGVNPDTNGVDNFESEGLNPSESSVNSPGRHNPLFDIGSTIGSAFTGAFSILEKIESLNSSRISQDSQMLNSIGGIDAIISDMIGDSANKARSLGLSASDFAKYIANGYEGMSQETAQKFIDIMPPVENYLFSGRSKNFNRNLQRRLNDRLFGNDEFINSVMQRLSDTSESASKYVDSAGKLAAQGSEGFTELTKELASLSYDLLKQDSKNKLLYSKTFDYEKLANSENAANFYNANYYNGLDSSLASDAFNSSNKATSIAARAKSSLNAQYSKFLENISKKADEGKIWAQAFLISLAATQNLELPNLPINIK